MNLSLILNKYRFQILTWASFVVLYFATRLYNIMSLPIFTDEAIYTRWAQIARFDPNWRFISLTDGKQPLFVWFDMIVMRFVNDPLLAGRLVSVFAGFATMVGLYFLGKTLFNKKVGVLASLLYIFYPFALVYDRMALYDSLVATLFVWGVIFEILLVRYRRLDIALILGFILGGAVLNKTSGFLLIYLFPLSLFLFNFKDKKWKFNLVKWASLAFLSTALAYGFYSVLRLSPFVHIIEEKNTIFVYTFSQWLSHPFNFVQGNMIGLLDWTVSYLTISGVLLVLASFFIFRKNLKEKLFLFAFFIVPLLGLALFGRVLYPRFILFMTMPLLILVAFSLDNILMKLRTNKAKAFGILVALLFFLRADFFILTDFKNAPIPYSDLEQYINNWPAGGGVKEIIGILEREAKDKKIYVASLGTFGSLPTYSVEIYLGDNKNIGKEGIYPVPKEIPQGLLEKSKEMPTFLFFSNQQGFEEPIKTWPLKLLVEYEKGIGKSYSRLYRISP
jgi:4-amino-4-deoxy-L-arabinose transferase-like glycosyltransferase